MKSGTKDHSPTRPLVDGLDYYLDDLGRLVFTEHYLLARGHCCENGCRHCPYGFNQPGALAPKPASD